MLPWIFLLLSAGAWWIVFTTRSMVELAIALIAAFGFLLLGFYGLLTARVGHVTRTQAAREKTLLLTTRPKAPAGQRPATGVDGGGYSAGSDLGGSPSGGRPGPVRARDPDDRGDSRDGLGETADGGGDGGGGGGD